MKNYHVCLKQSFQKHALNFKQAHYLDLPSGQVVVVGEMNDYALREFESEEGVIPLPFMLTNEKIPAAAASALAHIGVTETDSTMSTLFKIQNHHPAFSPTRF